MRAFTSTTKQHFIFSFASSRACSGRRPRAAGRLGFLWKIACPRDAASEICGLLIFSSVDSLTPGRAMLRVKAGQCRWIICPQHGSVSNWLAPRNSAPVSSAAGKRRPMAGAPRPRRKHRKPPQPPRQPTLSSSASAASSQPSQSPPSSSGPKPESEQQSLAEGRHQLRRVSDHFLKPLSMQHPARHFPAARRLRREVHLHIGPTNSGKSYAALQAFKAAGSGFYAGPLRMLAREIYDRMENEGIPCNLITGDEVLEKPDARLNSGTVEMMDLSREMEMAVIDEIQMIEDSDRGWAWTRAFLGVRAQVIHLCGDPNSEAIIRELVRQTGDTLQVHRYERLSPLILEKGMNAATAPNKKRKDSQASLFKQVQPGDCIVLFSKKQVQEVRDKIIQAHGNQLCCALVYGSLPPEIRAEQARLFNTPGNGVDYLVASDAIGMGLNLGIKRIIFKSVQKFDGEQMRPLSIPQIKQIAGRAGRYRTVDGAEGSEGYVNCVKNSDVPVVRKALATVSPKITQAVLMPPNQIIKSAIIGSGSFDHGVKFSHLLRAVLQSSLTSDKYCMPRQGGAADVAELFDNVRNLTFEDRLALANAPVPTSNPVVCAAFTQMCTAIGRGKSVNVVQLFPVLMNWLKSPSPVAETLEKIHKTITLFLWMSYRFPCNFVDRTGALDLKRLCEYRFNKMLSSRKSLSSPGRAQTIQRRAIDRGETAIEAALPFRRRAAKKRRQGERRKGAFMEK